MHRCVRKLFACGKLHQARKVVKPPQRLRGLRTEVGLQLCFFPEHFSFTRRYSNENRPFNRNYHTFTQKRQSYGAGIRIAEGYKLDKTVFTKEELRAVFEGLKGIDSVSGTSAALSLMEKLSLEPEDSVLSEGMILIDLASHYKESLKEKIGIIKHAVSSRHTVNFLYYYSKGEEYREIAQRDRKQFSGENCR